MVSGLWLLIFTENYINYIRIEGTSSYYVSSAHPELNITSGWCVLLTPA
ncbi:hypothetical protein LTSEADE_2827 [Salmonella enterica subsp. enterica serovar Adelaide str. A4-669]|uniref:Uncharacterized protein n=1 Tax=Salmonella enterica subsp. enterica serovar Adelaide str. A4-669 TaxID=913063 RepID=A0A6C8GM41_SALET|nr:hypothetical protein LTSEADE_2827 [Salmonella enterica subsp. enterica serovar Adelaide str. A4-669]